MSGGAARGVATNPLEVRDGHEPDFNNSSAPRVLEKNLSVITLREQRKLPGIPSLPSGFHFGRFERDGCWGRRPGVFKLAPILGMESDSGTRRPVGAHSDGATRALLWLAMSVALLLFSRVGRGAEPPGDQSEIVLGMSTTLSGSTADLGREMHQGVLAGLERANRAGGIRGRPLRLLALDDGYEPTRTAPNMRQLIQEDKVMAVIGNVGTPTAVAALPIAQECRTLFFAPLTGASVLRKTPPDRYVINYRASYDEESAAIVEALVSVAGISPQDIAWFTQNDAFGDAGFAGGLAALRRLGLTNDQAVLHVRYERNTLAVEGALARLLFAARTPRAVIMVGTYAPCAKFIKLARAAGLNPLFHCVSFVGSGSLAKALDGVTAQVTVSQVVPPPHEPSLAIVKEYQADLLAVAPRARPNSISLEGYIAARILVCGLNQTAGDVTREQLVAALEGLGSFELGPGFPLQLAANQHQACHRVWLTHFAAGEFVGLPWERVGDLINPGQP